MEVDQPGILLDQGTVSVDDWTKEERSYPLTQKGSGSYSYASMIDKRCHECRNGNCRNGNQEVTSKSGSHFDRRRFDRGSF
jgi:hypothetical protein